MAPVAPPAEIEIVNKPTSQLSQFVSDIDLEIENEEETEFETIDDMMDEDAEDDDIEELGGDIFL